MFPYIVCKSGLIHSIIQFAKYFDPKEPKISREYPLYNPRKIPSFSLI